MQKIQSQPGELSENTVQTVREELGRLFGKNVILSSDEEYFRNTEPKSSDDVLVISSIRELKKFLICYKSDVLSNLEPMVSDLRPYNEDYINEIIKYLEIKTGEKLKPYFEALYKQETKDKAFEVLGSLGRHRLSPRRYANITPSKDEKRKLEPENTEEKPESSPKTLDDFHSLVVAGKKTIAEYKIALEILNNKNAVDIEEFYYFFERVNLGEIKNVNQEKFTIFINEVSRVKNKNRIYELMTYKPNYHFEDRKDIYFKYIDYINDIKGFVNFIDGVDDIEKLFTFIVLMGSNFVSMCNRINGGCYNNLKIIIDNTNDINKLCRVIKTMGIKEFIGCLECEGWAVRISYIINTVNGSKLSDIIYCMWPTFNTFIITLDEDTFKYIFENIDDIGKLAQKIRKDVDGVVNEIRQSSPEEFVKKLNKKPILERLFS